MSLSSRAMIPILLAFAVLRVGPVRAANAIESGKIELYPTWSAVGIELSYSGDDNHNAQASFVWRRDGDAGWRNGVDMTIDHKLRLIWASVWPLEQGEIIHIRITIKDPDGGDTEVQEKVTVKKMSLDWKGFQEFYVSHAGDDASPGSREKPFKTLGHAARLAKPGTVVFVLSGTYAEGDLFAGLKGTLEKPIVFAAAPGQTPVVDSSLTLEKGQPSWKEVGKSVFVTEVNGDGGYVAQDGRRMFRYPSLAELQADKLKVGRAWFYDSQKKLLHVRTGTGSSPSAHTYNVSRQPYGFHLTRSQHVIIRGFTVRHAGAALVRISEGAQGCILLENKLHNGPGGVFMKSETTRDNAIWRNDIHEPGAEDISWNASYAYGYAMQAIYTDKAGRGNSFCHNRIHDHFDCISVESWKNPDQLPYNRDCDILFNELSNAGDDAIEVDGGGVNMRVHGNTIRQCFSAISLAPIERGPVYVTRNTASFLNLFFKFNVAGCTSHGWTYVYHNTGYCLFTGADGGTGISFPPAIPCSGKVLKNNIIIANEWSVRAGQKGHELDGNCYFNVPDKPPRRFQWNKKAFANLADFQQAASQEKRGLYIDPRLKNIWDVGKIPSLPNLADLPPKQYRLVENAQSNLELRYDSPCVDAAVPLRGINEDFQGKGPDIGAIEAKRAGR